MAFSWGFCTYSNKSRDKFIASVTDNIIIKIFTAKISITAFWSPLRSFCIFGFVELQTFSKNEYCKTTTGVQLSPVFLKQSHTAWGWGGGVLPTRVYTGRLCLKGSSQYIKAGRDFPSWRIGKGRKPCYFPFFLLFLFFARQLNYVFLSLIFIYLSFYDLLLRAL